MRSYSFTFFLPSINPSTPFTDFLVLIFGFYHRFFEFILFCLPEELAFVQSKSDLNKECWNKKKINLPPTIVIVHTLL